MSDHEEEINDISNSITAHKGHLTRGERSLNNAATFCAANPSAESKREVEEALQEVKDRARQINRLYEELGQVDHAELNTYLAKMAEIDDRCAAATQNALTAMRAVNFIAASQATAVPAAAGVQLKVQSALKPDKLTRENTPAELSSWARRFRSFYSMSHLDMAEIRDQQAFLYQCLDTDLEIYLRQQVDENTPIFGDNGCIAVLEEKFLRSYPLFTRRLDFFRFSQSKGQPFAEFYAKLRQKGDESSLSQLDVDALYVHRIICAITDAKLKEKLCKLQNPTLEEVVQAAEAYDVARKTIKDLNAEGHTVHAQKTYVNAPKTPKGAGQPTKSQNHVKFNDMKGKCFGCGGAIHQNKERECKAMGSTCNKCGRKNHFANVCFGPRRPKTRRNKAKVAAAVAEEEEENTSGEEETQTAVNSLSTFRNKPTPKLNVYFTVNVNDNEMTCRALPDSGASGAIISQKLIERFKLQKHVRFDRRKNVSIKAVNKSQLRYQGSIQMTLRDAKSKRIPVTALVSSDIHEDMILSWQDLIDLRILPPNFPYGKINEKIQSQVHTLVANRNISEKIQELKEEFSDIMGVTLGDTAGNMKGEPMSVRLKDDPSVKPLRVTTARQIPIHMKQKADELIDELLRAGVIVKESEPTDWVAPAHFVPKKNGKVRLVTDYRVLNQLIVRPIHPFPSAKDIVRRIEPSSKFFAKIDAIHGYYQIPLDTPTSKLTTFLLPSGRYRYLSAPMGLCPSSDEFCRRTDQAFEGLSWFLKLVDDGLIQSPDEETLIERIKIILERCRQFNIKISCSKLEWGEEVLFAGYRISKDGVKPDLEKVNGLKNFPQPTNVSEMRSFLGLVNQLCHFVPDMAHMTVHLRALLKKKNAFVWTQSQQEEFEKLKTVMCSDLVVKPFNPKLKTALLTDASRLHGIGFALIQYDQNDKLRVIECNSMGLNDAQRNYATIELECLAIQWAISKCAYYLRGMPNFKCITDHKPLVGVFKKALQDIDNLRLARMREKLVDFNFTVEWKEGKTHLIADALSRAPASPPMSQINTISINNITVDNPTLKSLADIATKDKHYQFLIKKWQSGEDIKREKMLSAYAGIWSQISLIDGFLVLNNKQIIVPESARKDVLKKLHIPHTGVNKTRNNAKEMFHWPGMSNDITIMTEKCEQCQKRLPSQTHEPLASKPTSFPMEEVGVDLFDMHGQNWIVMIDNFSGFPFTKQLKGSVTTEAVWAALNAWFLEFGYPSRVRADNGPQFREKFRQLCQQNGVEFWPSSSYCAESNGLAESAVKNIKKLLSICFEKNEDFRLALLEWRNCPKTETSSPAQLFFGRRLKGVIPFIPSKSESNAKLRLSQKRQHDKRAKALTECNDLDKVMVQHPVSKAWDEVGVIVGIHPSGLSYFIKLDNDKIIRRNRRFLRPQTFAVFEEPDTVVKGGSARNAGAANRRRPKNDEAEQLKLRRSERVAKRTARM